MKSLLLGIVFIILIGLGGLMYRNAVEYPNQRPIACQMDAKICPDGTAVGRTGSGCAFPECPTPNVSLPDIGIAYAVPLGFDSAELADSASVAAYEKTADGSLGWESIVIRRYNIAPDSTALETIQQTAIGGASGLPVPTTAYSSTVIGSHRFTLVTVERFEAIINTAYYLVRASDVLRFDAIDRDVLNWTEPNLDISKLPAHSALRGLLTTLQGG